MVSGTKDRPARRDTTNRGASTDLLIGPPIPVGFSRQQRERIPDEWLWGTPALSLAPVREKLRENIERRSHARQVTIAAKHSYPIVALPAQYRIDGSHAPAGSLYSPMLISVMGWTTRSSFARHHRKSALFRVGTRMPGPPKDSAEAMRACRSVLVSAVACPKKASSFV